MNLADHLIAAAGTGLDVAGALSSLADRVKNAERFEMSDDVVRACAELVNSRPSTLNAALPICRLPYNSMWIEYHGGVNASINKRDPKTAPIPARQGFLIEGPPEYAGRVGYATLAWVHTNLYDGVVGDAPFTSPFAIYFDWREDGDVRRVIRAAHQIYLEKFPRNNIERQALHGVIDWIEKIFLGSSKHDEVKRFFMIRHGWQKYVTDEKEIEAMRESENHMLAGLSPHGVELILKMTMATFANNNPEAAQSVLSNWLAVRTNG